MLLHSLNYFIFFSVSQAFVKLGSSIDMNLFCGESILLSMPVTTALLLNDLSSPPFPLPPPPPPPPPHLSSLPLLLFLLFLFLPSALLPLILLFLSPLLSLSLSSLSVMESFPSRSSRLSLLLSFSD